MTVKDNYNFFLQGIREGGKASSLMQLLDTVPGFHTPTDDGMEKLNMSIGMEYYKICEKMVEDVLLIKVKSNPMLPFLNEYIGVNSTNSSKPQEFVRELDYGVYDFKYRGFTHIYDSFKTSVIPIVGFNAKGDEDNGTAYYIGNNCFVTAAHCVKGLEKFNLIKQDGSSYVLKEVWYPLGQNTDDYDLAIVVVDEKPTCPSFWLGDPFVLGEVLTLGYPPIPGINPLLTAENASVAAYRKAVVGQVVADANTYFNHLDYFLISARVKGGNSGGPVINNEGKVIGTVIQLPFDSEGGFDGKRFDIMGFGICLPSKYIDDLIRSHDVHQLVKDSY